MAERWMKAAACKHEAGEVHTYAERSGYRHKFVFHPKDGGPTQTKYLEGSGQVSFEVPGYPLPLVVGLEISSFNEVKVS